jgi:D-alanine-D-alanine ligase
MKRVGVIYGGRSGEHEISIRSATAIMASLDPAKFKLVEYFITKEGRWQPKPILPEPGANPEVDVVFPVLHGTFGEDGTVQGLLELAGLPYVGAGVLASAVSMDKEMMKRVCRERGLPVVEFVTLNRRHLDSDVACQQFGYPMFVKALELAARYDRKIIVERGIEGREFECSVLGNEDPIASTPCEILPSREFYDYEDKYLLDQAKTQLPPDLPQEIIEEMRRLAVACYQAVECEGLARVDFLLETRTGQLYINEINTLPGFTSISMYPKMWEYSGIPFADLVERLIGLALERHAVRQSIRYER